MGRAALMAVIAAAALAACTPAPPPAPGAGPTPAAGPLSATAAAPRPRPQAVRQAQIRATRAQTTRAANDAARATPPGPAAARWQAYQATLLAQGRLRTDRAPADAPYDAATLARNFVDIALRDEYGPDGRQVPPNSRPAPLRRWAGPVRIQPLFGPASDSARQIRDRARITATAARLARASGHPVTTVAEGGNLIVMIATEAERRALAARLPALIPGLPPADLAAIRDLAPGNACAAIAYSHGGRAYTHAVAVIRAELPDLMRHSCIEEELAQAMGLANDSPRARPSVFNDDEEFALLTAHDAALLAMLYDPRLRPGMTEAQAAPLIHRIAAEAIGP